jgi:hypothetical protein
MVKGVTAKWVSGTSSTIAPIKLCGSNYSGYSITLNRNPSAPDFEKDMNFALQVQGVRAQQQQAQAARDAAAIQLWSIMSTQQQQNETINCTSTASGDTVYTDCR